MNACINGHKEVVKSLLEHFKASKTLILMLKPFMEGLYQGVKRFNLNLDAI